jgi:hypothetical protein
MSTVEQELNDALTEKRRLMKRIVNANKILKTIPEFQTVYCGCCGKPMKNIPLSRLQKERLEELRDALLCLEVKG